MLCPCCNKEFIPTQFGPTICEECLGLNPSVKIPEGYVAHSKIDGCYYHPDYFVEDNEGFLRFDYDTAPNFKPPQPLGLINYSRMFEPIYPADITSAVFSVDLTTWQMNKVENMSRMFAFGPINTLLGISGWDVSNVKDMSDMFAKSSIQHVGDLSNWDVSHVANMSYMFHKCNGEYLHLDKWNVSNVRDMEGMFAESSFKSIGSLSNWDVSHVTNMSYMFLECSIETIGDISNWKLTSLEKATGMLAGCTNMNYGDLSKWHSVLLSMILFCD